jgi:hypothetical protein
MSPTQSITSILRESPTQSTALLPTMVQSPTSDLPLKEEEKQEPPTSEALPRKVMHEAVPSTQSDDSITVGGHRRSLKEQFGRLSPRNSGSPRSGSPTPHNSHHRQSSCNALSHFDVALDTGKGVSKIVGVGLKSPLDFTLSLAKGFHNAPKLYGDESVREFEKITGLQSGLKAAATVKLSHLQMDLVLT